ncbi:MAG TPA: hypothetical protein VMW47_05090 [Verrucomicrobiae bacterium]|nr:hypothetical protein [Verrucomicrobiae bacterium]
MRRRTSLIGRLLGETSCLRLCWAVIDVVLSGAKSLCLTDPHRRHLPHLHPVVHRHTHVAPYERTAPLAARRSPLQQS